MKNPFKSLLVYTLLAFSLPVMAEDTDLFTASANPTELPNIMILMDNAANFSANAAGSTCIIGDGGVGAGANQVATALSGQAGGIGQCALYKVISEINPLPSDADTPIINVGIMMYNANGMTDINKNPCTTGGTGGCLLQPLVPLNKANKVKLLAWIRGWKSSGSSTATSSNIKVNNGVNGAIMQETWAYFTGHTGISGRSYASIKPVGKCNNFVVFVGNAYNNAGTPAEGSLNTAPRETLLGLYGTADMNADPPATDAQKKLINNSVATSCGSYTITASDATKGFMADEWARYMSDKGIITYTVGVLSNACKPSYAALLTNMGRTYGGGEYYPTTNYDEMVAAFKTILRKTQGVNSAFASVSLPVSVNTQGTFLNQVYIGMFRPDQSSLPRWQGNLKQYKLGELNGVLQLLDADDAKAISVGEKGFLDGCARSFWTPTSLDTYWSEKPKNNCATAVDSDVSNNPDGNIVEKGAQAYKLRSIAVASRNVKTCTSCSPSDFGNFNIDNTNITQALLGASTTTERDAIINWARGLNNGVRGVANLADEVFVAAPATAMRPSSHGDVVHSRPIAINYGTDVAPSVVVYYGGNDGILRAVNGNRSANIGSTPAGAELWSFVAPEFYSKIKRIRDNASTGVSTVDEPMTVKSPTNISGTPKDYGVDGVITAYKNASDDAYIYTTMRRGGRAVYAFDVTTPASPTLKWKIGCPNANNDSGCTSGFGDLGQTWSAAKIIKAAGYNSGASPLLIMGGGYDICHDADPNTSCSSSSKGNKIYVIDANTGTLLKTFNTDASVVGDITVVQNSAGLAKYAYAADMAGNVYRISGDSANIAIDNTAPDNWTITKIAALGGTGVDNRKFMFAPDVVIGANDINFVLLGSGDREKPLAGGAHTLVQNRFYVIKDKPTDSNWLSNENAICSANVMCNASLLPITISGATPTAAELEAKKGWYLALASSEQVVTSAITVFNTITFSTHRPTPPVGNACTTLGTATVYNLNYKNGDATNKSQVRGETITGGGLPPSPVAGMVILDNGQKVPFIIGANPESALQGGSPAAPAGAKRPKSRVYWNIKK